MHIRIIIMAGSVIIGACSIKQQQHRENSQKVTTESLHVQSDSLSRQDTLTELVGRQFLQENEVLDKSEPPGNPLFVGVGLDGWCSYQSYGMLIDGIRIDNFTHFHVLIPCPADRVFM